MMSEVIVQDKMWDEQTAAEIARLRAERRALMCNAANNPYCKRTWKAIHSCTLNLYKITGHEIYNPLAHGEVGRS